MKKALMIIIGLFLAGSVCSQSYADTKKVAETAALMEKFLSATCEEADQMSEHMYYRAVKEILGSDHVAVSRAYEYARLVSEVYGLKMEGPDSLQTLMMILREWKYNVRPDCFTSQDGGWLSVEEMRVNVEEKRQLGAMIKKADQLLEKIESLSGQ